MSTPDILELPRESLAPAITASETASTPGQWRSDSPWHVVRLAIAVVFAIATVVYSAFWMYYIRQAPKTTMGIEAFQSDPGTPVRIATVYPGTQAAAAGLRPGDRIASINGTRVRTLEPIFTVLSQANPGDHVRLGILKVGSNRTEDTELILRAAQYTRPKLGEYIAIQMVSSFPVLFVLVGLPVLFLRIDDRNAWMVAICFAGMVASAPVAQQAGLMAPPLRGFMLGYMLIFFPIEAAAFYYLFATFPARSPIDRRVPWLKNVLLFGMLAIAVPMAGAALLARTLDVFWPVVDFFGRRRLGLAFSLYFFAAYAMALVSLIWNSFRSSDLEARRKTRVIVWGTVVGILPWFMLQLVSVIFHLEPYSLPFWIWAPPVVAIFLMPLSFAYAVLKHRVLDVPVLLRRSARYLLVQRGFMILIIVLGVGATFALASSFERHQVASSGSAIPVGAGFGIALVLGGTWIHQRVSHRVDKAFFRSAYDTRQILEELLAKTREVQTREQLSQLLQRNLHQALHPAFLLIYVREAGRLVFNSGDISAVTPRTLADSPLLQEIFERGEPVEITPTAQHAEFARLSAECVVPICAREGQKLGLLILGPRKSEEPYSREDKRLLALVATSAAGAFEHIELAEEIASRLEAEKRSAHEIELAQQVQRKLFPQNPPRLEHLDYAGECVQARVVGGDYYDFLEMAPGIVAFALADISGKGFAAALLMANLQANLRGQYAVALDDLPGLMCSVNRLFCENTEPQHYATMFFGCYDDQQLTLRYVNCGHNPPLLLRANGTVERLRATATVLGLFLDWNCAVAEVQLQPGDVFAIYTDGVTEAALPDGEEFGEHRLIEILQRTRSASAAGMLRTLVSSIQQFSPGEQGDDLTAVIAKVV